MASFPLHDAGPVELIDGQTWISLRQSTSSAFDLSRGRDGHSITSCLGRVWREGLAFSKMQATPNQSKPDARACHILHMMSLAGVLAADMRETLLGRSPTTTTIAYFEVALSSVLHHPHLPQLQRLIVHRLTPPPLHFLDLQGLFTSSLTSPAH